MHFDITGIEYSIWSSFGHGSAVSNVTLSETATMCSFLLYQCPIQQCALLYQCPIQQCALLYQCPIQQCALLYHNVRKYSLVKIVTASFNTVTGQMTEIPQRKKQMASTTQPLD